MSKTRSRKKSARRDLQRQLAVYRLIRLVLVVWIGINTASALWHPFDPYPYILLNLILSCLAAIQAPIIMTSQNRMEARDRLRSEND